METWSFFFFCWISLFGLFCVLFFFFFFLSGNWRHKKKRRKQKEKRSTTHLRMHIYIFRIGVAKFSHSVIRTASIPVSRYYSSPSKLWKCWRKLYPLMCWGFPPKVLPLLQNLCIKQENVNSIDNFCFVDHQGLPLSPASAFFLFPDQL